MLQGEREITLRFLAEPTDINFEGKVRGGAVMKWIVRARYAWAGGWSGQYCVTVYVGVIRFYKPVLIDNVVEVSAMLIYTDSTSVHVTVEVSAGDRRRRKTRPGAVRQEAYGVTQGYRGGGASSPRSTR